MVGFIKYMLGIIVVTMLIPELGDGIPAWAQLIAYSLVIAAYVARRDGLD